MTTQEKGTKDDRPTLTEFIAGFGLKYQWLYADGSSEEPVEPDTDGAVFTARESFLAWETLRCLAPHIGTIRSCLSWDENGDVAFPLSDVEITLAGASVKRLWEDFDDRTSRFRQWETRYESAGRIALAIYRETIQAFLWHWEESYSDYNESWYPTQWTHEFPLALVELLRTLDREAALLAAIAGTSRIDSPGRHALAALSLQEHIARDGLGLPSTVHRHRLTKRLRSRDAYTAAHLVQGLDSVGAQDMLGTRTGADRRLAHTLGASEAIHTTLEAALDTWPMRSRMTVILDAFIRDVVAPTLRIYGSCAAVHVVLDAARARLPVGDAREAFIRDVVAPTLRYPTDDMPHYGRFVLRLRGLYALAREIAGDMRLFGGEDADGEWDPHAHG